MFADLRNESIAESRSRKSIKDVPAHHDAIPGRVFRGKTLNGLDFELRVVENTTNGQAINLLNQRIEEAKKARLEGKPMGQHMSSLKIAPVAKGKVMVKTDYAGKGFAIEVEMAGPGSYRVFNQYHTDLKQAVEAVMKRAELEFATIANASRQASHDYGRSMR